MKNLRDDQIPNAQENQDYEQYQVANRINQLEDELTQQKSIAAFQRKGFDALLAMLETMDENQTYQQVLDNALEVVRETTGFPTVTMRIYEKEKNQFRMISQYGMTPEMVRDLATVPADKGFPAEALRTKKPVFTTNSRLMASSSVKSGFRSLVSIPISAGERFLGSMELVTKENYRWESDELRWLALVGRSVGVVVRQVQLNEHLKSLVVMEERSRIAQEIHDGLVQLIASIGLWAEDAQLNLDQNNIQATYESLQKIETVSRDLCVDLRDEISGLREKYIFEEGTSTAIQEILNRFQRQWNIRTQFHIDESATNLQPWPISPIAEVQLLRILQEGLTNIRRHANASSVLVTVAIVGGWLRMKVEDDGTGFDQEHTPENRFGMRIMHERVKSIDGTIDISSQVGIGTQIEIEIPLSVSHPIEKGKL